MNIEELKGRLAKVNDSLYRVETLPPGRYSFRVEAARFKKDEDRKHEYLSVQLHCSGKAGEFKTSDRFPIVDELIWKFGQFCNAIGFSVDDLSNEKEFIGREGELVAVKDGDQTFYAYQKPE